MPRPQRCLVIFGTRPEAIKMAPLVLEMRRFADLETSVCVTAQHREMLDQVLSLFGIVPEHDLDVMRHGQTLTDITMRTLAGLEEVLAQVCPELVLVHGDTSTTFAGALAAFYRQIRVGHVEAGLRSGQKYAPFPEEMNRKLTGVLADLHFAPTASASRNLLDENAAPENIFVTGNTVIDALRFTVRKNHRFAREELNCLPRNKRLLLAEVHRRENLGAPLESICRAFRRLVLAHEDVFMVFPVHKNPAVREPVYRHLADLDRVLLLEPLDVADFHNLMHKSTLLLTDSGGVQEEAPALGRPVLVLREVTERPEAVEAGTVALVGVQEEKIVAATTRLLTDDGAYRRMANAVNPYGDGQAAARIVAAVRWHFGLTGERPPDFVPTPG
ncbi:MAG: UDP-N-acetylglucosamine 2-epimerase (non-hydrolyzing) [Dethiobacter sp.]|nr:UDP-N-acetylglucosamine 2-epimerase (non-hydrolyzing) [Dethiobacter sp.]